MRVKTDRQTDDTLQLHSNPCVVLATIEIVCLSQVPSACVCVLYLLREIGREPAPLHVPQSLSFVPAVGHLAIHLHYVPSV